jgi:hypothetical protein
MYVQKQIILSIQYKHTIHMVLVPFSVQTLPFCGLSYGKLESRISVHNDKVKFHMGATPLITIYS